MDSINYFVTSMDSGILEIFLMEVVKKEMESATTSRNIEKIFSEAVGIIETNSRYWRYWY